MHQQFHSTPTWTLKSRYETVTKSNQKSSIPGPADYHSNKPLPKAPTFALTTAARKVFQPNTQTPGPGSYTHKSHINDGPKRSMSARFSLNTKPTPGPHDYENDTLKIKEKNPAFSMKGRSKDFNEIVRDKNLYKPAPNIYDAKNTSSFNNPKGVQDKPSQQQSEKLIGTSKRKDLYEGEKTPGPGAYLTIDQLDKSKLYSSINNPRCAIGTEFRKTDIEKIKDNPGPGSYERKTFWEENSDKKKGYTMRPKTADLIALSKQKIPGPGHYQDPEINQIKTKAPRLSSTSDKRLTFIDNASRLNGPAPGSHDPKINLKMRASSSYKFSNSPRKNLDDNEKTPGPCHYDYDKINILNKAPGYSPTKSNKNISDFLLNRQTTPGPNVYDPKYHSVKESSRFSEMPKSQRPTFDKARLTPGPGYYDLRGKEAGPTWKFSTERRPAFTQQKEAKLQPGAGDYEMRSSFPNPPKYMMSNYHSKMGTSQSSRGFNTAR